MAYTIYYSEIKRRKANYSTGRSTTIKTGASVEEKVSYSLRMNFFQFNVKDRSTTGS